MSFDLLVALVMFAFAGSITPGPNNTMVLASSVSFGFRRTIPHMLGISVGFSLMLILVGLGLAQAFERLPMLYTILKYAGALYLLWLAWKIGSSGVMKDGAASGKPLTFLQAAAFQWVNPKAWVLSIGAVAAYTVQDHFVFSVLLTALVFGVINLPTISIWAAFGIGLRRVLKDERAVRYFNLTMAALLVASLWPVLKDAISQ